MRGPLLWGVLLTGIVSCAAAQRVSSPYQTGFRQPRAHQNPRRNRAASHYALDLFDPLYWDDELGPDAKAEPTVPPKPAPLSATVSSESPSLVGQPLLIELQRDRYVRLSAETESPAEALPPRTLRAEKASPVSRSSEAPRKAVLVFRDGHQEEVSGYTISDGFLYASAADYPAGTWTRKIQLGSLELSETVRSNATRGITFRLPNAPNEVIVGP